MSNPYTTDNPLSGERDIPVATVEWGTISGSATDNLGKYKENEGEDSLSIIVDYFVQNRYEKDHHRYMMPVTSTQGFRGSTAAFVQLAHSTLLWIADWTARRTNETPTIPNPEVGGDWVLLDEHYEPAVMELAPDGVTPIYRISGTYFYGHKNPSSVTLRDINFPKPPWMEDGFLRTMSESKLEQGIINLQGSGSNTTTGGLTGFVTSTGLTGGK